MTNFKWKISENGVDWIDFLSDYSIPTFACEDYFNEKFTPSVDDILKGDVKKELLIKSMETGIETKCVIDLWISVVASAHVVQDENIWECL